MSEPGENNFIRLSTYGGRTLFYSSDTGPFWSLGINAFMTAGANDPIKELIGKNDYKIVYEDQLKLITERGFNTLGTWSKLDELKERTPFGVIFPSNFFRFLPITILVWASLCAKT